MSDKIRTSSDWDDYFNLQSGADVKGDYKELDDRIRADLANMEFIAHSPSPTISDGTIDNSFLHALHEFTATVEGQLNARKGESLRLIDDTDAYWWLVINGAGVKGYVPAENLETPIERLARQNKYKNTSAISDDVDGSLGRVGEDRKSSGRLSKGVQFEKPQRRSSIYSDEFISQYFDKKNPSVQLLVQSIQRKAAEKKKVIDPRRTAWFDAYMKELDEIDDQLYELLNQQMSESTV